MKKTIFRYYFLLAFPILFQLGQIVPEAKWWEFAG